MDYGKSVKNTEEKTVKKVVKKGIKAQPTSEMQKLKKTFISDEIADIKDYAIHDILIPGIKDAISSIVKTGIDMMLGDFKKGGGQNYSSSNISYRPTNYNSYSRAQQYNTQQQPRTVGGYDFKNIIISDRMDAHEVLSNMHDLIAQYGMVNVADLYDLTGYENAKYTDNKYGWTDLSRASVERARQGGYYIKLPRAVPIN